MQKDVIILCTVLILIVGVGVGGYMYLTNQSVQSTTPKSASLQTLPTSQLEDDFIEVPTVTYIDEKDSDPKKKYTYNISYPAISLMGHINHAKETNAVIKTFALDMLNKFRTNLEEEEGVSSRNENGLTSDFTMRATPSLLSPTLISLRFDAAEYVAGGAHPNQQTQTLNYDIESRTVIPTEDLFASSSEALPYLSKYTRDVLRDRFTDVSDVEFESMVLPGTAPKLENFQSVAITRAGLLVIFNPYQVAPYARGTQEVLIPIANVSQMLNVDIKKAITLSEKNIVEATPLVQTQMEY